MVIELLKSLFAGRKPSALELPAPWDVLQGTGNGIGGAPGSLHAIPRLSDDEYEELYCDSLVNEFWHQGTIYAATPFAVEEVIGILPDVSNERQEGLLDWCKMCLAAELIGPAKPCYAGVWFPSEDRKKLEQAGIMRLSVADVLGRHVDTFSKLADGAKSRLAQWLVTMHSAKPVVFPGIELAESFVTSWKKDPSRFSLAVTLCLEPSHPEYSKPKKGDRLCQRRGTLTFANVENIDGVATMPNNVENTDKWPLDFGSIFPFLSAGDRLYSLDGEFGEVMVTSDPPVIEFESGWSVVGGTK